jgi:hypothetical protein
MLLDMNRRNGFPVKVLLFVTLMIIVVYFIYLHNDLTGRLRETGDAADRYRREQESLSAQLQGKYDGCYALQVYR